MKPIGKILSFGLLGCFACCAGPAVLLLVSGIGAEAAIEELLNCYRHPVSVGIGGMGAATLLALAIFKWRARKAARCACTSPPIVCTLMPEDFKARLADLKLLTKDALISGWRDDLTLHLRYRPEAEDRVRRMVEREQECCAFLTFDLQSRPDATELRITAPEGAKEAIGPIYEQFVEGNPL